MILKTVSNDKSLVDYVLGGMKSTKSANQNGRMYVSTSGFCERQTALAMSYVGDIELEPQTEAYFKLGLAIEDIVLNSLRKQSLLLFSQFETPDIGLNIGGKVDGIYKLPDGKIRLLEIKSCGYLPKEPYGENLAQANLYTAITGLPIDLLYFSRNVTNKSGDMQIKMFSLDNNPLSVKSTLWRVIYGKMCSEIGVMPNIPVDITSESDCGFCRFKSICWHNQSSHLSQIDNEKVMQFTQLTDDKVNDMMSPIEIEKRRNGVLKHLSLYGTDYAKQLLYGKDWDNLV